MIILIVILAFSSVLSNEPDGWIEEEELIEQYFKTYWESNDNINFKLSMYSVLGDQDSDFNRLKKIISENISLQLDRFTAYQINNLCHQYKKITEFCHQLNIHEIHYRIDPHNVNTYVLDLHEGDNEKHITKVLSEALLHGEQFNSFYDDLFLVYQQKYADFYQQHPQIYTFEEGIEIQESIKEIVLEINNNPQLKSLIDKPIQVAAKNVQFSFMAIMGASEFENPWFFYFDKLCANIKYAKQCHEISKIKTMSFDWSLIFSIKELIWAVFNNTSASLATNQDDELFLKSYHKVNNRVDCYLSSENIQLSLMINRKVASPYFLDKQNYGALEAAKKMSFSIYDELIKNGFDPSFNPHDCD